MRHFWTEPKGLDTHLAGRATALRRWLLLTAAALLAVPAAARAGTPYYWDGGTANLAGTGDGVSQGGSGTWDTSTANWDPGSGSPHVPWPDTTAADAVLAGTAGTVTLGSDIIAGNLSLGTSGYTIATGPHALTITNGVTLTAAGLLDTISSNTGAGGLNLTGGSGGGQTFNIAAGSTLVVSGLLSGSDTVTNAAAGRIGLTGTNNAFTGKWVINAGVLALTSDSALGAVPSSATADAITLNGGLLQDGLASAASPSTFSSSATFTLNANRGVTLGANGGTVQVGYGATNALTLAGVVSGTGGLTKTDTGTLVLAGNNTYAGATLISGGVLAVTANNALGTTDGGTTINGGATLDLQNVNYGTAETLTLQDYSTLAVSTGSSTFAGPVNVNYTNSAINVTGTALTLSGTVHGVGGGIFNKTGSGTLTLAGTTDNPGGRVVVAAGTLVLAKTSTTGHALGSAGNADYALTLNGGTVQIGSAATGGDQIYYQSAVQINAGAFDLNAQSEGFDGLAGTGGTITNTNAAATSTLTLGQNNSAGGPSFGGTITNGAGPVALAKVGTGSQTLAGVNTYTGGTTLNGGVLLLGVNNALPSTGTLTLTGGTLNPNGHADSLGTLALAAGTSTLQFGTAGDSGNVLTFSSATVSGGSLTVTNWDGSPTAGGGGDQFLVTANPVAVLSAITFVNPADLPPGTYAATDLGTGPYEIVPTPEPATFGLLALTGTAALIRRRRPRRA